MSEENGAGFRLRVLTKEELGDRDGMAARVSVMRRNQPHAEEYFRIRAHNYGVFFNTLIEEGFDPQTAIELTTAEFC